MKQCKGCKKILPLAEYQKAPGNADGLKNFCKNCVSQKAAIYRSTEHHKKLRKEYRKLDYVIQKEREAGHNRSEYDLEKNKRWREKNNDRVIKYSRKWYAENKKKFQAKGKLFRAIKKGLLKKPDCCQKCKESRKLQAHHPNYDKPLDVIWLCQKCHLFLHRKPDIERKVR